MQISRNSVRRAAVALLLMGSAAAPVLHASSSVLPLRPTDTAAVYVEAGKGEAKGDGVADDTAALQAALDRVQESTGQGIVYLGSGRYRVTHTLLIWPGVRLIGFGPQRPVLTLADGTPGYGGGMAYMVMFTGGRADGPKADSRRRRGSAEPFPGVVPSRSGIIDANPGTFYSAMSNVDFELGKGNPGAVGIRSHYAQHCFLAHMDFQLGSGMAGIHDAGNEAEDLHFTGGEYGIITSKPSPGWQFTLLDSSFDGQRKAAIQEHEAGLTLVNATIRNTSKAIEIDPGYAEELWVQNSRFENVSGPALTIGNEKNARTQINVRNVSCTGVPVFAHMRESGKDVRASAASYRVANFSHGLMLKGVLDPGAMQTVFEASPEVKALAPAKVIRALPAQLTWVDVHTLGVKGDGTTDDTEALLRAIQTHDHLYLPTGRYRISKSIEMRPQTVLIGMHPSTTQLFLDDKSPAFQGTGGPVPMLLAPASGHNIVQGIGLYAGGSNNRAAGAMWMAGADSLMDDVRFLGGHGTNNADGTRANPYNSNHTGDPDPMKPWDAQFPSLWVLNGGGGTFAGIWTPDSYAQAGMVVSNTTTPGHVYELSSEHHVRNEVRMDHAANWEMLALQTEEEWGEGGACLPLDIESSQHILVANFHSYRVVGSKQTFPYAVRVNHSTEIEFSNLHIDSDSKVAFDGGVYDAEAGASERENELAVLTIGRDDAKSAAQGSPVRRVADGFDNASGATIDLQGRVLFVDARTHRILRWSPASDRTAAHLELLRDAPVSPVNLFTDRTGNVYVVSYSGDGTMYRFNPDAPGAEWTVVTPQAAGPAQAGADIYLPDDLWGAHGVLQSAGIAAKPYQYRSADGLTVLPAGQDFVKGELYYGTKMADVLRSFSLAKTAAGRRFYFTDEQEHRTYSGMVAADGSLHDVKLFAEHGGEGVAAAPNGNVYIAAGNLFEYKADGSFVREIAVPERPTDVIFGGRDGSTLYILARTGLYQLEAAR